VRSGRITVKLPDLRPSASASAPPVVLAVSLASLYAVLEGPLSAVAGGLTASRPSPDQVSALEGCLQSASAGVDAVLAKATLAPLYMCCAMFRAQLLDGTCPGLEVAVMGSTLPVAAGLGSSAAFSVAAAAALLDCWCRTAGGSPAGLLGVGDAAEGAAAGAGAVATGGAGVAPPLAARAAANEWAYASECLFHGSPSGLDNTVSATGGALTYSRASGASTVAPLLGLPPLRLLVANTRVPKETGKLVAGVRVLRDAHPSVISPIIASIGAIAEEVICRGARRGAAGGEAPLNDDEYAALSRLVRVNHALLGALGVGHAALDAVVAAAAAKGWAAKLTGAGGGGCALVLLPPSASSDAVAALVAELKSGLKCDVFETGLGGMGLTLDGRA
jgi:mevalonate kinase